MSSSETRMHSYWWIPLVFGVIFIVTGIWILKSPAESFEQITKFIGVIILVSGTTELLLTIYNRKGIPGWGYQLTGGLIDLVLGLILILNPAILLKIVTLFVAIWLMVGGVMIIVHARESQKADGAYYQWEYIFGVFLLLLAVILLWHPMIIGFTIAIWTAMAFIILGIFRITLTIRLRRYSRLKAQ